MTALVRSTRGATSQVEYGWFVKRDIASLTLAAEQQAFRDVLLSSGFGVSGPDYVRQDDGTLIDMFGFVLGSDGSLRNVNNFVSYNAGPLSRYGNVAIDGLTVSMDYCRSSNVSNADCPNPDAYRWYRYWEMLKASDQDGDGQLDRLYVLETLQLIGDTDGDGEYDDAIYALTSRPNFYDVDTTYDLDDIDGDGVANDDDAAPFDPLDGIDSDEDGFADQVDAFPNDSTEWEDLDGDGIGDNADPEISRFVGLAELTSESVASGSIQQAEPFTWIRTAKSSMDNPDFDPWAGSAAVNFYPNGVYEVPDRSSTLGTWTLNGDVIEVSFEPRLDYRSLDESTPELFDLDAWDEAGRPRFEVEEISTEEYRLIEKNETGWLVAWRYQSTFYVTGFEDPPSKRIRDIRSLILF